MTLSEIRTKCRNMLNDDVGYSPSSSYWSDTELNEYINESVGEAAERSLCILDSLTDDVCLIPLVANQRHYALHGSILSIEAVQPSWQDRPLDEKDMAYGWLSDKGLPCGYTLGYSNGYLSVDKAPESVTTEAIRLTVKRLPVSDMSKNADVPEIPNSYHRSILNGVLAKAYSKQDGEVYNPAKAKYHQDKWDLRLAEMVRRESRSKKRNVVTRSVELS